MKQPLHAKILKNELQCRYFQMSLIKFLIVLIIIMLMISAVTGCQHSSKSVISQAYITIVQNHFPALQPEDLIERAIAGMQDNVGKDKLSFTRDKNIFLISSAGKSIDIKTASNIDNDAEALEKIRSFVKENNPQSNDKKLTHAAIEKMVSLDSDSEFIKVEEKDDLCGIGLRMERTDNRIIIVNPIEESPAEKAGVLPQDRIINVDSKPVDDLELKEVVKLLRGKAGTQVTIEILREGSAKPLRFNINRDVITIRSVKYKQLVDHYAYIRVTSITENTDKDFDEAFQFLKENTGGKTKGIILDLRNNSGGLFKQAINISSRFVQTDLIVSLQEKTRIRKYGSIPVNKVINTPLIILVNKNTANGAEIVAGVCQEYKKAIIVGTPTHKQNIIRSVFPVEDDSFLILKTAIWLLPSGRSIEKTGIIPDLHITASDIDVKNDIAVQTAIKIFESTSAGTIDDLRHIAQSMAPKP